MKASRKRSRDSKAHVRFYTPEGEVSTKKYRIIRLSRNNPDLRSIDIANMVKTSQSYVENVLSEARRSKTSPQKIPRGSMGIEPLEKADRDSEAGGLGCHGLDFRICEATPFWYDRLEAPILNERTGMKQIGFLDHDDPCSIQVHRSGKVVVYAHGVGWEGWLFKELMDHGWSEDQAYLVRHNLRRVYKEIHVTSERDGKRLPRGFRLPVPFGMILRDESPHENTLEIKILMPKLEEMLRTTEILKNQELIFRELMMLKTVKGIEVQDAVQRLLQDVVREVLRENIMDSKKADVYRT